MTQNVNWMLCHQLISVIIFGPAYYFSLSFSTLAVWSRVFHSHISHPCIFDHPPFPIWHFHSPHDPCIIVLRESLTTKVDTNDYSATSITKPILFKSAQQGKLSTWVIYYIFWLLPREAYMLYSAVLGIVILSVSPPVCLSVRLSHACFVTKQKNIQPIF